MVNIFYTDSNPAKAVKHLDNLRIRKMFLESLQILSTALRTGDLKLKYDSDKIYKSFNPKHPSCLWVRKSIHNFDWLLVYTECLSNLNKETHKSQPVLKYLVDNFSDCGDYKKHTLILTAINADIELIDFYNNINELKESNNIMDRIEAYKIFYSNKARLDYRNLQIPEFIKRYRKRGEYLKV